VVSCSRIFGFGFDVCFFFFFASQQHKRGASINSVFIAFLPEPKFGSRQTGNSLPNHYQRK